MRWLLDTNVLIDAFAGRLDAIRAMTAARSRGIEWVGYSAMTRLEVFGFAGLSATDEKGLRELLAEFHETAITSEVIEEAIRIRKKISIKVPDAIIAATALVGQAELVTRNIGDFKRIAGLTTVDPSAL